MTLHRTVLTAALLSAALGAAPAAHAAGTNRCKAKHTTTLASDGYARVYAKGDVARVCVKKTGVRSVLAGASASQDVFTVAGKFVGYSSAPADGETTERSVVNVIHIPDHKIPQFFPNNTNDHVDAIVVKPNGAAAWAATPDVDQPYVQGMDRVGHSPDTFSDDQRAVDGTSLTSEPGAGISWAYTDGTTDTVDLFTEPAPIF